ncbi:MAG: hypothetical protein ACOZQL_18015 [Myxococcota bacterium]
MTGRLAVWVVVAGVLGCAHLSVPDGPGRVYDVGEATLRAAVRNWFDARGLALRETDDPHVWVTRIREQDVGKAANLLEGRRSGMGASAALDSLDPGDIARENERLRTAELDDRTREASREFRQELEDAPIRLAETPTAYERSALGRSSLREGAWGKSRALYTDREQWRVVFTALSPTRTRLVIFRLSATDWDSSADRSFNIGSSANGVKTGSGAPAVVAQRDPIVETQLAEHLDRSAVVEVLGAEAARELEAEPLEPAPSVTTPAEPPSPGEGGCGVDVAQLATAFKPGAALLFGDLAGTDEAISGFRGVVCHALAAGFPLIVGLPLASSEQRRLNAYLESDGSPAARASLLAGAFWRNVWPDGRGSLAMLSLIEQLRSWRSAGRNLTAVALDVDVPGNTRTAFASARILAQLRKHPEHLLISLMSNTMASRRAGTDWGPDFLPVGYRLAAAGAEVLSFDLGFEPGTQWTCRLFALGRLRCGTWNAKPGPRQKATPREDGRPFVWRFTFPSKDGFDGLLFVGGVHASPPAVPSRDDLGDAAPRR